MQSSDLYKYSSSNRGNSDLESVNRKIEKQVQKIEKVQNLNSPYHLKK